MSASTGFKRVAHVAVVIGVGAALYAAYWILVLWSVDPENITGMRVHVYVALGLGAFAGLAAWVFYGFAKREP